MARPTLLSNPEIFDKIVESLALGMRPSLIADSLGIPETTVCGWKLRKDFRRKLALKKIELAQPAIEQVKDKMPLAWLERHPEFREDFAPPKQSTKVEGVLQVEFVGFAGRKQEKIVQIQQAEISGRPWQNQLSEEESAADKPSRGGANG